MNNGWYVIYATIRPAFVGDHEVGCQRISRLLLCFLFAFEFFGSVSCEQKAMLDARDSLTVFVTPNHEYQSFLPTVIFHNTTTTS